MLLWHDICKDLIEAGLVLISSNLRLRNSMTEAMRHNQAVKFNDCFRGECYCDKPCPRISCQGSLRCENHATDVSSLDGFTPMCEKCKARTKIKFDKFMSKNRGF